MEGMSRAVGAGTVLEFGGREYIMDALTLEDYGILKNYLVEKKRKDMVSFVVSLQDVLPADVYKSQLNQIVSEASKVRDVNDDELDDWLRTPDGAATSLWLVLNKRYKDKSPTKEEICTKLEEDFAELRKVQEKQANINSVDEPGKSLGQGAAELVESHAASTGEN